MTYQLNFAALWPYLPELLSGLLTTIELTVMATIGGIALGICGAAIRCGNTVILRRLWGGYVEIVRNTPFVVQLFSSFWSTGAGAKVKRRAGRPAGDDNQSGRLQHGDYPFGHSGQCQRPMGGRAGSGLEP